METRFYILKLLFEGIRLILKHFDFVLFGTSPAWETRTRPVASETAPSASAVETSSPIRPIPHFI